MTNHVYIYVHVYIWDIYVLCVYVPAGKASSDTLPVGGGAWSCSSLAPLGLPCPVMYFSLTDLAQLLLGNTALYNAGTATGPKPATCT